MKKLIILPGNSKQNKEWGEKVAKHYGSWFDDVYAQDYDHWQNGEEVIDFEVEAKKLRLAVQNESTDTQLSIFAKSYGSVLALLAIYKGYISPKKCVFFGMPLDLVEKNDFFKGDWSFLSSLDIPSIAFHNDHDPVASYDFTSAKLAELKPPLELIATNGATHGYDQMEEYDQKVREYLEV